MTVHIQYYFNTPLKSKLLKSAVPFLGILSAAVSQQLQEYFKRYFTNSLMNVHHLPPSLRFYVNLQRSNLFQV